MLLYNIGIHLFVLGVKIASLFNGKAKEWIMGRRDLLKQIASAIQPGDRIVWIHAASLGEFEQGRPVIEQIKARYPEYKVLLTFFSPSGYNVQRDYKGADYVFYLPADTPHNAKRFIKIVRPEVAITIKYEFWLNLLHKAHLSGCKSYVISSIFRSNSVFFKWYGGKFRDMLVEFTHIFTQNTESKELLATIGVNNVVVAGDTRFDRVASIARSAAKVDILERFKGDSQIFIAGSTWPPDEELIMPLIHKYSDMVKFVIAPHEMDQQRIDQFISNCKSPAMRYTKCSDESDMAGCRVLIIDTIGVLSKLYRYGEIGYIGGGFGVGIHNTLEAATFGLPLAFGPNYKRFKEACDMVDIGVAKAVSSAQQLDVWFESLLSDSVVWQETHTKAEQYVGKNIGATDKILDKIFIK